MLNLIADLYNDKIDYDIKHNLDSHKMLFDEFFVYLMKDRFKMKKIVKRNSEEAIAGILKYSFEDRRIDLARRFLGIGDNKLRIEVLEEYFTLIKGIEYYYKLYFMIINYLK